MNVAHLALWNEGFCFCKDFECCLKVPGCADHLYQHSIEHRVWLHSDPAMSRATFKRLSLKHSQCSAQCAQASPVCIVALPHALSRTLAAAMVHG